MDRRNRNKVGSSPPLGPRLSQVEALILDLLVRLGPSYGLALVQASDGALKRGTVYVTLGRMEEKGLVESRRFAKPEHGGLPRPLYRATALGARAHGAALAAARAWRRLGARRADA